MASPELIRKFEVPWEKLRWKCDPNIFAFECTDELTPPTTFIGQERAIKSIQFGLDIDKPGYNLFVTGLTGTGKASAIKSHLEGVIADRQQQGAQFPVFDWCYVHSFTDPDRPKSVRFPPGRGRSFQQKMRELLATVQEEIPKVFASEEYLAQRREVDEDGRSRHQNVTQTLEHDARAENFGIQFTPVGVNVIPLVEGKPLTPEEFMALGEDVQRSLEEKRDKVLERVQVAMEELRTNERSVIERVKALDRSVAEARLNVVFHQLLTEYADIREVMVYLESLKGFTLDNLDLFRDKESVGQPPLSPKQEAMPFPTLLRNPFLPFEVNVLVDNSGGQSAPVIVESNPTWSNLFGRIERRPFMGTYFSDHTMIKAGSIHLANGGYIVLNAKDLLVIPAVWQGLKRVIRNREISVEEPAESLGFMGPQPLRPEPLPLDLKIIVMGDEVLYRMLSAYDQEDFWELFKVKAEFDSQIDLTPENVSAYSCFICGISESGNLLHSDRSGVAAILEYSTWLVSDQAKLSARFGVIRDVLFEADYWARKDQSPMIFGEHVKKAIKEKLYRLNLIEERLRELIAEGVIMVDVEGEVVGQVNGLSVYELGDFSFGRPVRITSRTFAGRRGLVNIERESQLSGKIHDKGVLIISGYLGWKYAQDKPLSLSASICFEQSYEGVEGDSASSTELYAILSSLAEAPIKQNIAVTGSVNQKGEIQPIGGANQKIEGFYDVCRVKGFTGEQGVIIPHQNLRNLVLREDIVESVKEGSFYIYAVKSIDEGIEILTGLQAGERSSDGSYPEGTINYRVDKRLRELGESLKGFYGEMMGG
ncbi:MAG: putative ATP-dependent protease [Dehalococcoidia bacterium]|nr:putative ATP-dependent protease [Dehalococcoidia bacterium]